MKRYVGFVIVCFIISLQTRAQPTNLQTSTANDITYFSWDPVSSAQGYVIEIIQSWDSWNSPEVVQNVSSNSFQLTGITQSISIEWRVKALFATSSSAYSYASYTLPCSAPSSPVLQSVNATEATLSWTVPPGYNTFVSDFVLAYRIQGSSNWISAGHTSQNTKTLSNLLPNTTYEWCVNQSCLYFDSNPIISTFTTALAPPPPPPPTPVCVSQGNNAGEWISYFKLGSISRSSGAESGGYVQTSLSTNVNAGSMYNGQIQVGNQGAFTNKQYKIYLDLNQNNLYEESEGVYGPANITGTKTHRFKLYLPYAMPNGNVGMRVVMARNGTNITACASGFLGETEDYILNVSGGTSSRPADITSNNEEMKNVIYPNPANSQINILAKNTCHRIEIYDIAGRLIKQISHSTGSYHLAIHEWASATYFVHFIHEDGSKEVIKFLKN